VDVVDVVGGVEESTTGGVVDVVVVSDVVVATVVDGGLGSSLAQAPAVRSADRYSTAIRRRGLVTPPGPYGAT
jgi:hypothetical protein